MKKGINQWAFISEFSIRDAMELAKRAGFESIELNVAEDGEITLGSSREEVKRIVRCAEDIGIEISSLATGLFWTYSPTSSDPEIKEKAKNIVVKMLKIASWLGVDTILVVPGGVQSLRPGGEIVPYDEVYNRASQTFKELAQVAEEEKVCIGIENVWNKFFLSPIELRDFIDQIGSDWVGCYFDVGNVLLTGFPQHWIRILGRRIRKVHFKDFKCAVGGLQGFVDLLEGDVDWPEVLRALREVGYDGHVVAEVFPYKNHPEALIWNTSKSMDFILGRV